MKDGDTVDRPEVERPPEKGRIQFSMRALILVPLVMVIFVGLAVFVDVCATLASYRLFGIGWEGNARHWLLGVGVPVPLVTRFICFAITRVPGWLVLAVVTFTLGLRRSRHSHFLAWLLALAFPFSDLIYDAWFDSSSFASGANFSLLTSFHIRIVSAFGFVVGIAAWSLGWWIRGCHYDDAVDRHATWMSRSVQIAAWAFVAMASAYGWYGLASLR